MNWTIVLDSSCDINKDNFVCKNADIKIAPLKIIVGDKEFVDDEDIDTNQLLQAMKHEKKAAYSACPSPEDFLKHFEGADNIVCITMTGALSGTNNSARIAMEMAKETNPNKNIIIIDSHSTAGTMVLLAKYADILIGQNLTFEQVAQQMKEYNKTVHLVFSLVQFDNLVKTGRMKPIAGMLASHLGIRAVAVNSPIGTIEVASKTRGENKTYTEMVKVMNSKKNLKNCPVVINHCNNKAGAERLAQLIKEECKTKDITIMDCKGLTAFYAMEGGILIGY